ncbi:MAG: hypothetical protein IT373_03180 [Polyangiaceae bacterium]|nr:hypothetical protein [Polyangiaceae bacterium]
MNAAPFVAIGAAVVLLGGSSLVLHGQARAAAKRLVLGVVQPDAAPVAVANDAEAPYCTPEFKNVLARVINACGLTAQDNRRGCQPADVKSLAQISDADFNALFTPLKDRGAVLMFDDASEKLDDAGKKVLDDRWQDRKGARYFFVVARASKTGTPEYNEQLSHKRANSVLFHVADTYPSPDLDKQVGLLWLGNQFAQLGAEYCQWNVSRTKGCNAEAINRSAFVSWVDCQL